MSKTTTDLLNSIKSRGLIPTSQNTFSDSQLLALADEEIQTGILPRILPLREEYFTAYKDYSPDGKEYDIPTRAIGMALKDVVLVDGNGREPNVPEITQSQRSANYVFGFYLKGNKVVFTSTPSHTVRLKYHIAPSSLITVSSAAKVVSISDTDVEVGTVPSNITEGSVIDFVKANPGYEALEIDQTITGLTGSTLSFSSIPDGLAVGDYICLAGQAPVVQLPPELFPVLAQRTVVKVLEALGDQNGLASAQNKLSEMEDNVYTLLSPRVEDENRKIINRYCPLRSRRRT